MKKKKKKEKKLWICSSNSNKLVLNILGDSVSSMTLSITPIAQPISTKAETEAEVTTFKKTP